MSEIYRNVDSKVPIAHHMADQSSSKNVSEGVNKHSHYCGQARVDMILCLRFKRILNGPVLVNLFIYLCVCGE